MAQTTQTADAAEKPESGMQKAEQALQRLVLNVVDHGVGPVVGSAAYAEARRISSTPKPDDGASDAVAVPVDVDVVIAQIIRESVLAAGGTGFVTGIGGFVALPLTFPANVTGNIVINARMVGAIAYLLGHDLEDAHVQASILLTVAAADAPKVLAELGVEIGSGGTHEAIKKLPVPVVREINRRASFFLVAKYGGKRLAFQAIRAIPLVGGVVGGGIDASLNRYVGARAERTFAPAD
jgi:hypothetical protein